MIHNIEDNTFVWWRVELWESHWKLSSMHDTCNSCLTSGMAKVTRERVFPLREATVPLLLKLCPPSRWRRWRRTEKEGHTASTHWNDGSLCWVGQTQSSWREEDNVSESLESARNKKRRAENGQRGGTRRRGCEVNVSPKVSFCQVWRYEDTPICLYLVFSSTTVAYQETFMLDTIYGIPYLLRKFAIRAFSRGWPCYLLSIEKTCVQWLTYVMFSSYINI